MRADRLGERHWQIVELVAAEGLDYGAVAVRLELSVRTVQEYAAEARSLAGVAAAPKAAMFILYRELERTRRHAVAG